MRFERPDGKNRWDSPLFTIQINGNYEQEDGDAIGLPRSVTIPFEEIFASLLKVISSYLMFICLLLFAHLFIYICC